MKYESIVLKYLKLKIMIWEKDNNDKIILWAKEN
jgi:hypothetical protein